MATQSRISITNLAPNLRNVTLKALVIAKQSPRLIQIKKDDSERCVFSFTVRDSSLDSINANCWGNAEYVQGIYQKFSIGDIVEIKNPQTILPPPESYNNIFQPQVSRVMDDSFEYLYHEIGKMHNEFYTLCDVMSHDTHIRGQYVNLLVAVREMMPTRDILTRKGKHLSKREVKMFDHTSDCFSLMLWDDDNVNLSDNWTPQETILFIADARITFDEYRNTLIASTANRTVITAQPNISEAENLRQYAESVDISTLDAANDIASLQLNASTEIFTVSEIQNCISNGQAVNGILYAFLTGFDLDGTYNPIRCSRCRLWVSNVGLCPSCMSDGNGGLEFSLRASLADGTGTLDAYIPSKVIQNMLGVTVKDFIAMDNQSKTELKWLFLLEQLKIYFKTASTNRQKKTYFNILKCEKANTDEMLDTFENIY